MKSEVYLCLGYAIPPAQGMQMATCLTCGHRSWYAPPNVILPMPLFVRCSAPPAGEPGGATPHSFEVQW